MKSEHWLKIMIGYVVVVVASFGLATHIFSLKRHRFELSKLMILYSATVIATFTAIYGLQILHDYREEKLDLKNATKLYSYINIFAAFACYIVNLYLSCPLRDYLNRVRLFQLIEYFGVDGRTMKRAILLMGFKAIFVPVFVESTLLVRQARNEPERSLVWTVYTLFPAIVASTFPNCFFGAMVICRLLVKALNQRLTEISGQVNFLQSPLQLRLHKPYYRMRRFCELAESLDALAEQFHLICTQTTEYLNILALPFVFSLLANLFGMVAGLFTQYLAIAESLINEEPFDVFNSLTNGVFLFTSLSEIVFQANMCHNCWMAVHETGQILQEMELKYADERYKASVESFALLIRVKDFKIVPMGLLEINIALVHDVFSTVTSFLLILIQSDLTLRFSLK